MNEEWRTIPSFPNYEASSLGRVRRIGRSPLKASPNKKGYLKVCLYRAGERRGHVKFVHFAVCEAFHGLKPDWASECAHGDGNKLNNCDWNLRWTDSAGNRADGIAYASGERASNVILTQEQVDEIRQRYAALKGVQRVRRGTRRLLADEFGVSESTIDAVTRGINWRKSA